ncbi:MAG: hypothetical protein ABIJ84_03945 [bacterium]
MSTFQELVEGIKDPKQHHDLRISLIKEIEEITKRKLIVYAADFNKSHPAVPNSINQLDLTCFSDLIEKIDGDSIDILIHSPGGSAEATEQLVSMLRENYKDIRFIIPRMAKSAATMLALSGNKILMDDRSELGPTDPQVVIPVPGGIMFVPAKSILNGFNKAKSIIESEGTDSLPAYLPMLNKYDLHLLEICETSLKLAEELVSEWLRKYMFEGKKDELAKEISSHFLEHDDHKSHARPITISKAKEWKLDVEDMRENKELRDKVWKLYCAIELFFDRSAAVKLYENAYGTSLMKNFPQPQVILQGPPPPNMPQRPQEKPKA